MPTPSLGYVFGKTHGLPRGFTVTCFGPPGGGKSLIAAAVTGHLHKTDPEALVIKFNTEMRENGQMTKEQAAILGVDLDRYICYDTNNPITIFDTIEQKVNALCQEGAPIRLVIIDSLNNIQGRRSMGDKSVEDMQMGDEAMTLKVGMGRILPVIRKHKIGFICTNQVRANFNAVGHAKKTKMAAAWATQHQIEYFLEVGKDKGEGADEDLLKNKFVDKERADIVKDTFDKTGFKVKFTMEKSSLGVDGRSGEFTYDFKKGIINTHEEVFLLGVSLKIIERPNNITYVYKGEKWRGKEEMLISLRDNPTLYNSVLNDVKALDK
jgi:RecA/RadA recombinase